MSSLFLLKTVLSSRKLHRERKASAQPLSQIQTALCRVCNDAKGSIPIFPSSGTRNIALEIESFSGVVIEQADDLSKWLCQKCLNLLNKCVLFKKKCRKTDKKLREVQNVVVKNETSEEVEDVPSNDDHFDKDYDPSDTEVEEKPKKIEMVPLKTQTKKVERKVKKVVIISRNGRKKKSFLCETCGKVSATYAGLQSHMTTHSNEFPFKCDLCPYRGRHLGLLRTHQRVHLPEKPYKCHLCPKTTTCHSNLKRHLLHSHSTVKPFKCSQCDKGFFYQRDVRKHELEIHMRTGQSECDICGKKFNTKKTLRGHKWKVHKVKSDRKGRVPDYLLCEMKNQREEECMNT